MSAPPGLLGVSSFALRRADLRAAQGALQEFGLLRHERWVLITGQLVGTRALLRSVWVPRQIPESHDRGLSITVPGDELQRLNMEWSRRREQLMVQIHSHPGVPYHSETDDRFAMVTIEGGLSIVVPLFGFTYVGDLHSCAIFRLRSGVWSWLPPDESGALVKIV